METYTLAKGYLALLTADDLADIVGRLNAAIALDTSSIAALNDRLAFNEARLVEFVAELKARVA